MELSAGASEKEAPEAVLFPDTPELGWATSREQGATESWDLLARVLALGLPSCKAAAASLLSSHWCFEGPPTGRTLPPAEGPRASAAQPWGSAGQGASEQLDRRTLNLPLLQGGWSLGSHGNGFPSNMPASGQGALTASSSARPLPGTRAHSSEPGPDCPSHRELLCQSRLSGACRAHGVAERSRKRPFPALGSPGPCPGHLVRVGQSSGDQGSSLGHKGLVALD